MGVDLQHQEEAGSLGLLPPGLLFLSAALGQEQEADKAKTEVSSFGKVVFSESQSSPSCEVRLEVMVLKGAE